MARVTYFFAARTYDLTSNFSCQHCQSPTRHAKKKFMLSIHASNIFDTRAYIISTYFRSSIFTRAQIFVNFLNCLPVRVRYI